MKKPVSLDAALALILSFCFIIPSSLYANGPVIHSKATQTPRDERQVENEREQAVLDALSLVDPTLASQKEIAGEVGGDKEIEIRAQTERLRQARQKQFKYLPSSYIRRTINAEGIFAKQKFLQQREKSLNTVIERSIQSYLPAQIAKERITLARFRIAKAIRDFFPEASLSADVKKGSLSENAYTSDNWRMRFRIPIFRGGVLWNTLFLELSNLDIARREYDKSISDLVADVSEAYFDYERTRNILKDQQGLFEKAEGQKKISDQKYTAKIISEIEKLNADSLFSQAQYDLETAQQEVEIAKLELQKFLNLESQDPVEIDALYQLDTLDIESLRKTPLIQKSVSVTATSKSEENLDQLIDLAYENRPDLQVEASKLKATQFAYRVALGRRLPQFDLLVEFGELAEAFLINTDDPNHRHEFRLGMEMTWPFLGNTLKYSYDHDQRAPSVTQFQSGAGSRTRANSFSAGLLDDMGQFSSMMEAKVSNLEQIVELEKTERDVIREVKEAYFNFNKALIQVESAYKRMGYRNRLAQLAKHRLETNEIQVSEYLQAEMDYAEERGLVYKALSDFFLSKAKLNRALGIHSYMAVGALE